jgi:hypothetical protein
VTASQSGRIEIDVEPPGGGMPRYLVERVWDSLQEEEMAAKGPLSKRILTEDRQFSQIVWEHSHMVMDEDGQLKSFCVYSSPNTELIREHAELLGDHMVTGIYEIGGDISPADFD